MASALEHLQHFVEKYPGGEVMSARMGRPPVDTSPVRTDQCRVHIGWTAETPMIPGRRYGLSLETAEAVAWITKLRYEPGEDGMTQIAAQTAHHGEVAVCNLSVDRKLDCRPFDKDTPDGVFTLSDLETGELLGVGVIDFSLYRATNLTYQDLTLDKRARALALGQSPAVVWLTGLSGAGKSTIANAVEAKLQAAGKHTYILDGDNVRHGLNRDLGFTDVDRVENVRRFAEVAKLFADAGLIVLVSVISPFHNERQMARDLMDDGDFIEVHVDASLQTCESRDPKGLYNRARRGEIKNFTGIDSPYEPPENPDLHLNTDVLSPEDAASRIVEFLDARD